MNNILILDLTANYGGWEFDSAQQQENLLNSLGLTVYLEKFEELTECLRQEELSSNHAAQSFYNIQNKFQERCNAVNLLLNQIDYVNIRCHGEYESGQGLC